MSLIALSSALVGLGITVGVTLNAEFERHESRRLLGLLGLALLIGGIWYL